MNDQNLKLRNCIVMMVFLVFIGFFGIAYIVVPDREYSELENRYLTTFPEFSWRRLLSGEFMSDFDSYTADQIYGKDLFVTGHVAYNRMLGIKEINGVLIGRDDYLIQDYQEPGDILDKNLQYIQGFAQEHPDITMTMLLAPNVNAVYPEELPAFAQTYPQDAVITQVENTLTTENMTVVDVTDALLQQKDRGVYYKTDHHWTTLGAFFAYKELCGTLDIPARHLDDYEKVTIETPFYGSLYSKAPVIGSEGDEISLYLNPTGQYQVTYVNEGKRSASMYEESYLTKKDKYAVFFGGNYALVTIENPTYRQNVPAGSGVQPETVDSEADQRDEVLIIKDSYANAIVPFLADHYRMIHMIDLRYYHEDLDEYIRDHHIQQIIFIHNVDFLSTDNSFVWLK